LPSLIEATLTGRLVGYALVPGHAPAKRRRQRAAA
jgi:hypothetical protein